MAEEVILLLVIGHLIGDFLLQTEKVVVWKQKEWRGAAFHGLLVALAMQIVLLPFYPQLYTLVAIQGFFHALIDWVKSKLAFSLSGWEIVAFLLDQLLHLLVILGGVYLFAAILGGLPSSLVVINLKALLTIITYLLTSVFAVIFLQMLVNLFLPVAFNQPFVSYQSRLVGLVERILITTGIIYGSVFLLLIGLIITPLASWQGCFQEAQERVWLRFFFSICWALLLGFTFNFQYL